MWTCHLARQSHHRSLLLLPSPVPASSLACCLRGPSPPCPIGWEFHFLRASTIPGGTLLWISYSVKPMISIHRSGRYQFWMLRVMYQPCLLLGDLAFSLLIWKRLSLEALRIWWAVRGPVWRLVKALVGPWPRLLVKICYRLVVRVCHLLGLWRWPYLWPPLWGLF